MPLFEVHARELVPFRRLHGGADLYEREIESLLWSNAEEFTGETLFRIARQPTIPAGGRPDIVALDEGARVVVIEVKRDVDRGQLAQCLEYAGWARSTSLDELAGMYHRGSEHFFGDWQEFTDSDSPVVINRSPRLMLVARDFHGRTQSGLDFLIENRLPVKVLEVSVYEDNQGRRFIDVSGEHEPELLSVGAGDSGEEAVDATLIQGKRVRLTDLMERGLLQIGDELVWDRPRVGSTYRARLTNNGAIELEGGGAFASPSRAAMTAASIPAYDGWYAWRVLRAGNLRLHDLRLKLADERSDSEQAKEI